MSPHTLHQELKSGKIHHAEFTRESWEAGLRDSTVSSQWTHPKGGDCASPASKFKQAVSMVVPVIPTTHPMIENPVILVDGMNIAFRSHFAHQGLTNEDGEPTGAYYGFIKAIFGLSKISPRIVVCWDNGIPLVPTVGAAPQTWRKVLYKPYKATRTPSEDTATAFKQLPLICRVLQILGYPMVGVVGLEADDIIGILVGENPDNKFLIHSSDRDMYQLICNTVSILKPGKENGKFTYVTRKSVLEEYSVPIDKWPVYLALGGDSSDHIKPMAGMGPKTAQKLLEIGADPTREFKDNPKSFRNSKWGVKLEPHWATVRLMYQLAHIPTQRSDARISPFLRGFQFYPLRNYPGPAFSGEEKAARLKVFTQICADNQCYSLLDKRREFFV